MVPRESQSNAANILGAETTNLYGLIDKDRVHGLNLVVPEDARAVIKPWDERDDTEKFAESGVDDQMTFHIPFVESVRLRSVLLKIGRGEVAPSRLRIFLNYPNIIDFNDAESIRPQLDIQLLSGETGVVEYPLRVAAFASVTSVSLFLSDSDGGDTSRVYYVGFRGDRRSNARDANTKLEIRAENAADAPLVDRLAQKTGGQRTTAR